MCFRAIELARLCSGLPHVAPACVGLRCITLSCNELCWLACGLHVAYSVLHSVALVCIGTKTSVFGLMKDLITP